MISNGHFKRNLLCCDVNSVRAAEVYAAFPYCLEFLCFLAFLLVFFILSPGQLSAMPTVVSAPASSALPIPFSAVGLAAGR